MRTRQLLAGRAIGVLVGALLAAPSSSVAQGLFITGYGDFEATIANPDGGGNSDFYFDNHHFNLIMIGNIHKDLFAAAEVEYEHAGEEIALEYGYFAYTGMYTLTPRRQLRAGAESPNQRIIFTEVQTGAGRPVPPDRALATAVLRYPLFFSDLEDTRVVMTMDVPPRHTWGMIPVPAF